MVDVAPGKMISVPQRKERIRYVSERHARSLDAISAIDEGTRTLIEMVEAIFHIEDLFELSKGNSFIALNFFQLMSNIDYVLLVGMTHDKKQPISPAGSTSIAGEIAEVTYGGGNTYENNLEGVVLALSQCFKIQANKMNALIDVNAISAFMQGTGAAQIAQDAVNAFAQGGMKILESASKAAVVGA